jgi:hypothetical protein
MVVDSRKQPSRAARLTTWLRNNGSIVVSLSSFIVALVSLLYSIEAQRIDREYKEASIAPVLSFETNSKVWSIKLTNRGLGPAVVTSVLIKPFGDSMSAECIDSSKWIESDWERYYRDNVMLPVNQMVREMALDLRTSVKGEFHVSNSADTIGNEIIPAGSSLSVVSLSDGWSRLVSAAWLQDKEEIIQRTQGSFHALQEKIFLTVNYCTLTRRFCWSTWTNPNACGASSTARRKIFSRQSE